MTILVMAGLDPAIHAAGLLTVCYACALALGA